MSGWRNLEAILNKVQSEVQPPPTADNTQSKIKDGLLNMFEPVLDVFELLRTRAVDTMANGRMLSPLPLRGIMRRTLHNMSCPQLTYDCDRVTSIVIRIATRTGLTYPDVITTAKWRCVLLVNHLEVDNQLYDNRDMMASWIFKNVLNPYSHTAVPPLPPYSQPTDTTAPADTDMWSDNLLRVIMLDDQQTE